jgi:hypothetical protein
VIILTATALMQWHGIQFWTSYVGIETGWAWSISLELAALWLWVKGAGHRWLAFLASCLLLAGPLFHIAEPALRASSQVEIADRNHALAVEDATVEIATLESSLETALRNSEARTGWLNDIQQTRESLSTARQQLRSLLSRQAVTPGPWPWIKTVAQAAALLVIWSVSIMAITELTKSKRTETGRRTVSKRRESKKQDFVSSDIGQIVSQLEFSIRESGLSQGEWADLNGISRKNISLIRNHDQRVAANKEVASNRVIKQVAEILGIAQSS